MVTLKTGQPWVPLEEGTGTASETDINGVGEQTRTVHTLLLTTTLPLCEAEPKLSQLLVHFTGGMGKGRKGGSGYGHMRRRASPSGWCGVTVHNQGGVGPVQPSLIAWLLIFLTRWLEIHRLGMIFNLLWHRVSALYYNSLFPSRARLGQKAVFLTKYAIGISHLVVTI